LERILSQEERIRRAEEIYYRRKNASDNGIRVSSNSVNAKKSKLSLFKKMALQLAICAVIYIIFYLIKNTNYIFSDSVINKTKELLSHDINLSEISANIGNFIEENKNKINIFGTDNINTNEESEDKINNNEIVNNTNEIINEMTNGVNSEINPEENIGIGGAEENETVAVSNDESLKKTQMDIDAEYIKSKCSFKIPVKGTVTSRYGQREATEIVSANHQGIDIGANTGTAIYASMEGTVSLVSSEGDYRKTYRDKKWRNNDKICSL